MTTSERIKKDYRDLKKRKVTELRYEWTRNHIIGDPKSLDKEGLVSDILRAEYGHKKVDRAFNIK